MNTLSNAQLEIIKMFEPDQSEEELRELKEALSQFLAKKLAREVLKESQEKGYTPEQIDNWKNEHFRTPYK